MSLKSWPYGNTYIDSNVVPSLAEEQSGKKDTIKSYDVGDLIIKVKKLNFKELLSKFWLVLNKRLSLDLQINFYELFE